MPEPKSKEFIGDYVVEMYAANGRVYYTVRREGGAEVLSLGDQATEQEALAQAQWTIQAFAHRDRTGVA